MSSIKSCSGTRSLYDKFATDNCADSFDTVCDAAYTDNPPFSCETQENPDLLTTLGAALANASAFWAVLAIIISVGLKKVYPGGVSLADAKRIAAMKARAKLQEGVKAVIKWKRFRGGTVVPELVVNGAVYESNENVEEDQRGVPRKPLPAGAAVAGAAVVGAVGAAGYVASAETDVDDELEDEGCIGTICAEC